MDAASHKPLGLNVIGNSGIMEVHDIKFALELIHAKPIGPLAKVH